ncbi:group 1 glycosyl transferase [Salinigranum rubrum]|uniref:Group 1 glycosyl transferase n=1 Tax=Salinigranum rubrum TaxID=755307 RepID=A0A2I8VLH1_9EURY|nr:glycosyltransferase [Salinigranum rubrum]AUV82735.1 group 1 glycosyl transferase [Salinigranum rubrum]
MFAGEATSSEEPTVLAMPDYRESNPYQAALATALEGEGVDIRTVDGRGLVAPVTRAVLAAGRPSVLHIHFLAPYMVVENERAESLGLAELLSVLLGVRLLVDLAVASVLTERLVWTAHDLRNHKGRALGTERALKHLFVRLLCDAVVVHCDRAKDVLVETFSLPAGTKRKMWTVPHGSFLDDYPDETTRSAAREALDLPADATVLLFFGWIRAYKNVPELIETFAELDHEDARLVVAGNPRTDDIARQVRDAAADDDRVDLTLEFVPDDEVQTYMRAADVVTLPFETEEQSLLTSGSVLLAMGFERAVVAPRLGCVGELLAAERPPLEPHRDAFEARTTDRVLTDGGATGVRRVAGGVVYERTSELGEALRTALDADLGSMGARNRSYAEALRWDAIAARTRAVYLDE